MNRRQVIGTASILINLALLTAFFYRPNWFIIQVSNPADHWTYHLETFLLLALVIGVALWIKKLPRKHWIKKAFLDEEWKPEHKL